MKTKHRLYKFVFELLNKFVLLITKGKKKLLVLENNKSLINYEKIKNFIYRPIGINYFNKILFLDKNYGNLYSIYELVGNKYSDYIQLKSDLDDLDSIKKIYNYKIIVVNSDVKFLDKVSKKNQLVVCVWHALGAFKKVGKYNINEYKNNDERECYESFFDFLIVSGKKMVSLYADAFNMREKNVLSLGLPQIDKYFNKDLLDERRKKFFEKFDFLKNKKIYGFFPTLSWKNFGSYWKVNFKKLASLLNDDEIIVFKLHPTVNQSNTDFYEVKNKVINLSHIDNLVSICHFESIITDYSSIIFEAMIYKTNLVFLKNECVEQEFDLWLNYDDLPGNIINPSINPIFDLEKNILENLRTKYTDKVNYKNFYDNNIGNCDSKSSERIAEFLLDKLQKK